ncbi:MAG: triose-phosphate isomerase [Verrucomicrobiota bacterium]|nr:triose-phosphate isomerase [Verrucomicrobiota bacterium]
MRKNIIAGNWKMNKTFDEASELSRLIARDYADCTSVDIVLCPSFTSIKAVSDIVSETQIQIGAQNFSHEDDGAFTGEISYTMLKDLFVKYVILGHSERREFFGETDDLINKKLIKALDKNLKPIVCVGESLDERETGITKDIIKNQIDSCLLNIPSEKFSEIIIAYEPVWAIGTGKTATAEQAQDVHSFIRQRINDQFGSDAANIVRIQYGGSMKASNAQELLSQPDIDGGLIGGASLDAQSFGEIVKIAIG